MAICGGWDNRINGALAAYIMANVTGRKFKFEHRKPQCDITNYIIPNKVNWSLPHTFHKLVKQSPGVNVIQMPDNHNFKTSLVNANYSEMINSSVKYVYFSGNLFYELAYKCSKVHAAQVSWMKDLYRGDVKASLYKHLFKLSGYMQDRINRTLSSYLPTPKHRLVCAHVRMGKNPSNPKDSETRNSRDNLAGVWKFLLNHSLSDFDKVFVASDSAFVTEEAKRQSFGHRIISLDGPIHHVDRFVQQVPIKVQ